MTSMVVSGNWELGESINMYRSLFILLGRHRIGLQQKRPHGPFFCGTKLSGCHSALVFVPVQTKTCRVGRGIARNHPMFRERMHRRDPKTGTSSSVDGRWPDKAMSGRTLHFGTTHDRKLLAFSTSWSLCSCTNRSHERCFCVGQLESRKSRVLVSRICSSSQRWV